MPEVEIMEGEVSPRFILPELSMTSTVSFVPLADGGRPCKVSELRA